MTRLVTCICVLTISVSCILAMSTASVKSGCKPDVLVVFITGNELGALKPCGCSGGQLGGLDRRAAVFDSVPPSKRLIIDTGSLVETDSEQNLFKFHTIIEAFRLLDYDLVNLTERDIEIAQNLGLLNSIGSILKNIITPQKPVDANVPAKFTKQLSLKGKTITVTVAAFDAKSTPVEQVGKLFTSQPDSETINILILNQCDDDVIASITEMAVPVDCLVCPAESDEPMLISDPNQRPLVFSTGRYGKYVAKLQIMPAEADDRPTLSFSAVAVTEDLPQEESLLELYKDYQQLLKEAGLLEKHPRFVLPNGLKYVGSKHCYHCHSYEYEKWAANAHAHAYATLERLGSQYDPECVTCHVVGAEYESGFISEEKTSHLKNVGCENCHGPGSKHIKTPEESRLTIPMSDCTDCHTPDRSADYADNEPSFFEKIIHWREPNIADNVK